MATAQEMREFLDRLYDSFGSGDPTAWTASAADDVIGIGSDPDEWWEGRSQVTKVVAAQVEEMSTSGVHLQAGDPRIFARGDVVWSVDRPVLHLGDGREVPMRVTVIAVSEAGTLRLKHFHYSVRFSHQDSPSADTWETHHCRSGPCASEVPNAAGCEHAPRSRNRSPDASPQPSSAAPGARSDWVWIAGEKTSVGATNEDVFQQELVTR